MVFSSQKGDLVFRKKAWFVFLAVLTVMIVGVTGCTDSNDSDKPASIDSGKESGMGLFAPKKFVYSENFSLIGEVESSSWSSFTYNFKGGELKLDLPKEDDRTYYSVDLTTHDPESAVHLWHGYNYTYKYKEDKFSDYTTKKSTEKKSLVGLGYANKMHDTQGKIFCIRPISESGIYLPSSVGLDAELIDRDMYLILEIDEPDLTKNKFKVGDIIRANGHITIKELSKEEATAELERQGLQSYSLIG